VAYFYFGIGRESHGETTWMKLAMQIKTCMQKELGDP